MTTQLLPTSIQVERAIWQIKGTDIVFGWCKFSDGYFVADNSNWQRIVSNLITLEDAQAVAYEYYEQQDCVAHNG